MDGQVLSLVSRLKQKKEGSHMADRMTCIECGHKVESEDDWNVCVDQMPSRSLPVGARDSGILACPECDAQQPHNYFDGLASFEAEGGLSGLHVNIPKFYIDQLLEDLDPDDPTTWVSIGSMIENVIRSELQKAYGERARMFFPPSEEVLAEMKRKRSPKSKVKEVPSE